MTQPVEWDAGTYHRVSVPQRTWGLRVLGRLALRGDERVLDAGCGTGLVTAALAERVPRGRVVALDRSPAMASEARRHLPASIAVVHGDLLTLPFADASFDVLFSTATFHWVLDPAALYRSVARVLAPGGRLHAQCGGAGNVQRLYGRAMGLTRTLRFSRHFAGWSDPWVFLSPEQVLPLLRAAGLEPTRVDLEATPTPFASRADFRVFVGRVVVSAWLARLPDDTERDAFLDALCDAAGADDPPYVLDYVRLNIEAVKRG